MIPESITTAVLFEDPQGNPLKLPTLNPIVQNRDPKLHTNPTSLELDFDSLLDACQNAEY